MKRDASHLKRERLNYIARLIAAAATIQDGRCDLWKTLVTVQFNVGLTEKKAKEYVELVCKVKEWDIIEDEIIVTKPKEEAKE